MKHSIFFLIAMLTLNVGCGLGTENQREKSQELTNMSTQQPPDVDATLSNAYIDSAQEKQPMEKLKPIIAHPVRFVGNWIFIGKINFGGQQAHTNVSLKITQADEHSVNGEFSAILNLGTAPAARINAGVFEGVVKSDDVYDISWEGDRGDSGTAKLYLSNGALQWDGVIEKQTDYTLPSQMILVQNRTHILLVAEKRHITDVIEENIKEHDYPSDVEMTIELVVGDYAKVYMEGTKPGIEGAFYFLKKNEDGTWRIVIGPTTNWDSDVLVAEGFPQVMLF